MFIQLLLIVLILLYKLLVCSKLVKTKIYIYMLRSVIQRVLPPVCSENKNVQNASLSYSTSLNASV